MDKESIYCDTCNIFKPLEMFENLIYKPLGVSDQEITQLNERRKQEKQLIIDRDFNQPDHE